MQQSDEPGPVPATGASQRPQGIRHSRSECTGGTDASPPAQTSATASKIRPVIPRSAPQGWRRRRAPRRASTRSNRETVHLAAYSRGDPCRVPCRTRSRPLPAQRVAVPRSSSIVFMLWSHVSCRRPDRAATSTSDPNEASCHARESFAVDQQSSVVNQPRPFFVGTFEPRVSKAADQAGLRHRRRGCLRC